MRMPRPRHAIDIFNDVRYWTNAILNYWPAARPSDGYFGLNVFMSACLDALSDTISDEVVESMVSVVTPHSRDDMRSDS